MKDDLQPVHHNFCYRVSFWDSLERILCLNEPRLHYPEITCIEVRVNFRSSYFVHILNEGLKTRYTILIVKISCYIFLFFRKEKHFYILPLKLPLYSSIKPQKWVTSFKITRSHVKHWVGLRASLEAVIERIISYLWTVAIHFTGWS